MRRIVPGFDVLRRNGLIVAGPSRSGMVFCIRAEQRLPAAHAHVGALLLRILVFARERRFRAFLPGHVILLGRQLCLPIAIALLNFVFVFLKFLVHESHYNSERDSPTRLVPRALHPNSDASWALPSANVYSQLPSNRNSRNLMKIKGRQISTRLCT